MNYGPTGLDRGLDVTQARDRPNHWDIYDNTEKVGTYMLLLRLLHLAPSDFVSVTLSLFIPHCARLGGASSASPDFFEATGRRCSSGNEVFSRKTDHIGYCGWMRCRAVRARLRCQICMHFVVWWLTQSFKSTNDWQVLVLWARFQDPTVRDGTSSIYSLS